MKLIFNSLIFLLPLCFSIKANAQVSSHFLDEQQPKYEIGLGAIGLQTPFYPGANQSFFRAIPFPFFIYRGDFLRADDEGTRARLQKSRNYEFGLSMDFNFPVDSNEAHRRYGMPDLDAMVQIGPRFLLRFLPDNPSQRLNFTLALRGAFVVNPDPFVKAQGLAFEPGLSFWNRWDKLQLTFSSYLNFSFATSELNRFFYDVQQQYATADRPSYSSKAGLVESRLGMGLSKDFNDRVLIFTGGSWSQLDLAANKNSPLVETRNNFSFIVGFVWIFHKSEEKVEVDSIPLKR